MLKLSKTQMKTDLPAEGFDVGKGNSVSVIDLLR